MSDITITINLFGAFRDYGDSRSLTLPMGSTTADAKLKLADMLDQKGRQLVADSAMANDSAILPDDHLLHADANLSILPPVCGG